MSDVVRCKFTCQSVTKNKNWRQSTEQPFLYEAAFSAVTGESEENRAFFDATPNGTLKIGNYKADLFTPGVDYFIDISPA